MAGVRKALIVATDQYTDPKLTQLNAPAEDARALAEVLQNPDVGAYEVQTVLNGTCQEVEIAVATFFQSGARDDTLLVHFSCHGVKDLSGELYFATSDTKLPLLKVTAVSSAMVKQAMEESRASLILCLVDCCYSGAFTKSTKAAATVDLTERLGGRGRAVITASTSLQLALDGTHEASLFTHAVVEGLMSGEADRDLDGLVTLDEFYNYVHEKVTEKNPDQTPVKSFDVQGEVYVARRGGPITTAAPLPKELIDTLATGEDWQRLGAVSRLTDLLNAGHPGRALGARQALEKVRDNDDSIKVRKAAVAALEGAGDTEAIPLIPDYADSLVGAGSKSAITSAEPTTASGAVTDDVDVLEADTVTDGPVVEVGAGPDVAPVIGGLSGGAAEEVPGGPGGRGDVPGGGGEPPTPTPVALWKKIVIIGFAAIGAILMALIAIGLLVDDDGGGDDNGTSNGGEPCKSAEDAGSATRLADSELLVVNKDGARRQLLALDVDSGACREITLDDVALPTITRDRTRMFYLIAATGEPHIVGADGVQADAPLLKSDARLDCPRSTRPAESSDGGSIAIVCKSASGTVEGLFVTRIGGAELEPMVLESTVKYGPTWEGQESIVYVASVNGDSEPTVMMRAYKEDAFTEPVEGPTGWVAHPDFSEENNQLLYLRSANLTTPFLKGKEEAGIVYRVNDDDTVTRMTKIANAESPTWSPDGSRFVYAVTQSPGIKVLYVQANDPNAVPVKLDLKGDFGPPAWGPR